MEVRFRSSFLKDIKNISDPLVLKKLESVLNSLENAQTLHEIRTLKNSLDSPLSTG